MKDRKTDNTVRTVNFMLLKTLAITTLLAATLTSPVSAQTGQKDWPIKALDIPTDTKYSQQWATEKTNIRQLWTKTRGGGVIVAVLDSGLAAHPDINTTKILPGADFVKNKDGSVPVTEDPNGHGTAVTGIIAAELSNNVGIAGAASEATILPVRILDENGAGYSSDMAKGIMYAVQNGAKVINISSGAAGSSPSVQNALQAAKDAGVIVVAAAGNGHTKTGYDEPVWPAADERTIAVAASTPEDQIAAFSTRGDYVDLAAPGTLILSTTNNTSYAYMSGTSAATPYVTASVALLLSLGVTDPKTALMNSAVDIDTPGTDEASGAGRINMLPWADTQTAPTVPAPIKTSKKCFSKIVKPGCYVTPGEKITLKSKMKKPLAWKQTLPKTKTVQFKNTVKTLATTSEQKWVVCSRVMCQKIKLIPVVQ